jgi:hypothetical protein
MERKKLAGWLMYMIPAPLGAILYLQGVAFYEGSLAPYGLSQSFYPLSFEQALLESFLFYAGTPIYFFSIGFILALLMLPASILGDVAQRRLKSNNRIVRWVGLIGEWLNNHISKHKEALFFPGIIIGLGYVIIILMLLFVGPYGLARKASEEKVKKQMAMIQMINDESGTAAADIDNGVTITLKNGDRPIFKTGIMIEGSERMITLLTKDGLITIPVDKIESMLYKLTRKTDGSKIISKEKGN